MKIAREGQRTKVIDFGSMGGSVPDRNLTVYLDESFINYLRQKNYLDDLENSYLIVKLKEKIWEFTKGLPDDINTRDVPERPMPPIVEYKQGSLLVDYESNQATCSISIVA